MKAGLDMIEDVGYKLRMFWITIDCSANMFCDNNSVYKNTITPESLLNKKHRYIALPYLHAVSSW